MNLKQAAQQALEALQTPIHEQAFMQRQDAITALRAALAEADEPPRREPLADWAIELIAACCVKGEKSVEWALRAVERAHGIRGES
jgi:hypothetical protein